MALDTTSTEPEETQRSPRRTSRVCDNTFSPCPNDHCNAHTNSTLTTADAHKASAKIRSELPGRGSQAEKEAEAYGKQAGAKFDSAVRTHNYQYHSLPKLLLV